MRSRNIRISRWTNRRYTAAPSPLGPRFSPSIDLIRLLPVSPFPYPGYPLPIPLTSTLVVSFPPDRRSTASICELQECAPRAQRAPMPRPGSSGWHPKHSPVPVARLKIYPSLFHSALLSISLRPFIPYDSPAQAARYPLIPLARGELMLLSL